MPKELSPEEVSAKAQEDEARQHLREKEYDQALTSYEKAIEIYNRMGWPGQVGILKKEIEKIQNMKKFFAESVSPDAGKSDRDIVRDSERRATNLLKKAQDAATQGQLSESLELYKRALSIFEGLNFEYQTQKIRWEIQKLEIQIQSGGKLPSEQSIAEERAERIEREHTLQEQKRKLQESIRERERLEQKKQHDLNLATYQAAKGSAETPSEKEEPPRLISEHRRLQMEKLRELEEKKRKAKEIEDKAFALMDEAKQLADQAKFLQARGKYEESIKFLEQINWNTQIETVKRALGDLVHQEEELRKKGEQEKIRKETQEREFQQKIEDLKRNTEQEEKERIEKRRIMEEKRRQVEEEHYRQREEEIRKEKERLAKLEEEKRLAKSPEYVKKMQMADITLAKAQKFAEAGKIEQALERYRFLVDLYKELEYPAEKLEDINKKIEQLGAKQ